MREGTARASRFFVLLSALVVVSACYESHLGAGGDASVPPDNDAGPTIPPPPPPTNALDLLLMVDDSNSMEEEQAALAAELPALLTALATGDLDADGIPDRTPFTSLHVGVVTSDMGTDGITGVPSCDPRFGDDGILRTEGLGGAADCELTYPPFIAWDAGGGVMPADAAHDVGCVAVAGTDGCGFEQQLEAPLKALSPARANDWTAPDYDAPMFATGSTPHGDRENDGFVRAGSLLAVIVVSDEDDCSLRDNDLVDPRSATYGGPLNLRCSTYEEEALQPLSRYVEGFLQLRAYPQRFALFVLAGVPVDLAPAPGATIEWNRLIGPEGVRDARMFERPDAEHSDLLPSCDVPGVGTATPPLRMLGVARSLQARGARVSIGSICQADFSAPIASFLLSLR